MPLALVGTASLEGKAAHSGPLGCSCQLKPSADVNSTAALLLLPLLPGRAYGTREDCCWTEYGGDCQKE
jgi:hypothetical protein